MSTLKNLPVNKRPPVQFKLPWPVTDNKIKEPKYKRQEYVHQRVVKEKIVPYIKKTKRARDYQKSAAWEIAAMRIPTFGKSLVKILVVCFPPDDGQRHDATNLGKILMDTLQMSGMIEDDYQACDVRFVRRPPISDGHVVLTIESKDQL